VRDHTSLHTLGNLIIEISLFVKVLVVSMNTPEEWTDMVCAFKIGIVFLMVVMTLRNLLAYHTKTGSVRLVNAVVHLSAVQRHLMTTSRVGVVTGSNTWLNQGWNLSKWWGSFMCKKPEEESSIEAPSALSNAVSSVFGLPRPSVKSASNFSSNSTAPAVQEHCQGFLTARWGESVVNQPTLNGDNQSAGKDIYALVILNTNCCGDSFERLWSLSTFRICADGGANRLYDMVVKLARKRGENPKELVRKYVPDVIKGDLDSLRPDVGSFYQSLGTRIIRDRDQSCNDFYKALSELRSMQLEQYPLSRMTVMALGAFGGRFDQEMAAINALYEWDQVFERLLLLSEQNLGFLLSPGRHRVVPNTLVEGPTCGLLPVGGACRGVTTRGLKWDLKDQVLRFGGLVSSSNRLAAKVVEVQTRDPLLWMSEIKPESWAKLAAAYSNGAAG